MEGEWFNNLDMYVILNNKSPFNIKYCSDDWKNFCGFSKNNLLGNNLNIIQGYCTDIDDIKNIMTKTYTGLPFKYIISNLTKSGIPFHNEIDVTYIDSGILVKTISANILSGFYAPRRLRRFG